MTQRLIMLELRAVEFVTFMEPFTCQVTPVPTVITPAKLAREEAAPNVLHAILIQLIFTLYQAVLVSLHLVKFFFFFFFFQKLYWLIFYLHS